MYTSPEIVFIKDFDSNVELPFEFIFRTRFRPRSSSFDKNLEVYLEWCDRLFEFTYMGKPSEGYAYDISSIRLSPKNVQWIRQHLYYMLWFNLLPIEDESIPDDLVVMVKKPFVKYEPLPEVKYSEHFPTKYLHMYCDWFDLEYRRER